MKDAVENAIANEDFKRWAGAQQDVSAAAGFALGIEWCMENLSLVGYYSKRAATKLKQAQGDIMRAKAVEEEMHAKLRSGPSIVLPGGTP